MTRAGPTPKISAPWLAAPATQAVFDALDRGGFTARAVGGIVRNTLLGRPATDIDIATDARPEQTLALAAAAGMKTITTGLAHGTVTVMSGGVPYEITTLRIDLATDGRHADVAFTADWTADAARRDFTINALYCDRDGIVFDPLGGIGDLEPVRIRFIGEARKRIEEDYLRILRFFRFSAVFVDGGMLDAAGLAACAQLREGLTRISGERIRTELLKLLCAPHAVAVTLGLIDSGVFSALFDIPARHRDLCRLAEIEARLGRAPDPVLRLAALTAGSPRDAARLHARLKFSAHDRDRLAIMPPAAAAIDPAMDVATAQAAVYRLGSETYRDGVLIAWARHGEQSRDCDFHRLARLADSWEPPVFPLAGRDVVAAGVLPGPQIGEILGALEDQWIASGFRLSREELRALLQERRDSAPRDDRS